MSDEEGGGVPAKNGPLVVCVDDDPPVLSAVRRLLRHEPYELVTTVDPAEVLSLLDRRKIDLIIADQRMPLMPGTELLKAVRRRSPGTVGVILTGHADVGAITDAMRTGAVDRLVKKPWDDEGFRDLIRSLLTGGGVPEPRAKPPEPPPRVAHAIDCENRSVAEVLSDLSDVLHGPEGPPAHVMASFENLLRVRGSVTVLLTEVLRVIVGSGARATLIDASGTAGTFLELVGGSLPLVVYRKPEEMAAPRHILIVEDQEDSLDYLQTLLQSAGHTCETVASVSEAVSRLKSRAYDLVLLDLVLPDADGVEVARHVLEAGLRTPVIAVSAFIDRTRLSEYEGLGIRQRLAKPYRAREILDAIRDS